MVEIVEHAPPLDVPGFRRALAELREAGLTIALDDVGLGQSNYKMILDVRPDIYKLDRYLVAGAWNDPYRQVILDSLARMVRRLEARAVAEGVEDTARAGGGRGSRHRPRAGLPLRAAAAARGDRGGGLPRRARRPWSRPFEAPRGSCSSTTTRRSSSVVRRYFEGRAAGRDRHCAAERRWARGGARPSTPSSATCTSRRRGSRRASRSSTRARARAPAAAVCSSPGPRSGKRARGGAAARRRRRDDQARRRSRALHDATLRAMKNAVSLSGSVEDLPLLEILQVVSFCQKTGHLTVRAAGGRGRRSCSTRAASWPGYAWDVPPLPPLDPAAGRRASAWCATGSPRSSSGWCGCARASSPST